MGDVCVHSYMIREYSHIQVSHLSGSSNSTSIIIFGRFYSIIFRLTTTANDLRNRKMKEFRYVIKFFEAKTFHTEAFQPFFVNDFENFGSTRYDYGHGLRIGLISYVCACARRRSLAIILPAHRKEENSSNDLDVFFYSLFDFVSVISNRERQFGDAAVPLITHKNVKSATRCTIT